MSHVLEPARPRAGDREGARVTALATRAVPRFPGATIEVDATGRILSTWLGPAAPPLGDSPDVLEALDVDPGSTDASLVQLLLASAVGAPGDAWAVFSADAPAVMHRRDGRLLAVSWDAIVGDGAITAVALFALAIEAPRSELEDPVEIERICSEALTQLDECDTCLLHLAQDSRARASVHRLFRAMHTIKGSMRGTKLRQVRDLAHETEFAIEQLREFDDAPGHLTAQITSALRQLRAAIGAARPRGDIEDAMTDLLRECRPALVELQLSTVRLAIGDDSATVIASRAIERIRAASERAHMRALGAQAAAAARAVEALAEGASADDGLVEDIALLDRQLELYATVYREVCALDGGPALLSALGGQLGRRDDPDAMRAELAALIAQVQLPSLAEALADPDSQALRCAVALLGDAPAMFEPCHPRDEATRRFERVQRELSDALDTLSEQVPNAALAPLRAVVERLTHVSLAPLAQRVVHMTRSLASELGKSCDAQVDVTDIVVVPATARVLAEILLHAVRNALDHGIEPSEERLEAGKEAEGRIEIAGYALGERLVVTVRDDGRGVDIERVRRLAIERGLMTADAARTARAAQLVDLLFHPGFSTAKTVTMVSGRGIGMDVIRSLAEEHGGSVTMASTPGRGTELTIELPLSRAGSSG